MSETSLMWLLVGGAFCFLEFVTPIAFVSLVMGLSAFVIAPLATIVPFNGQVVLWMALSLVLFGISRSFVRPRSQTRNLDADYAFTVTEILPGETGRVNYEGQSWSAQLDDPTAQLSANQKVRVIDRQGTMLIVSVYEDF